MGEHNAAKKSTMISKCAAGCGEERVGVERA